MPQLNVCTCTKKSDGNLTHKGGAWRSSPALCSAAGLRCSINMAINAAWGCWLTHWFHMQGSNDTMCLQLPYLVVNAAQWSNCLLGWGLFFFFFDWIDFPFDGLSAKIVSISVFPMMSDTNMWLLRWPGLSRRSKIHSNITNVCWTKPVGAVGSSQRWSCYACVSLVIQ